MDRQNGSKRGLFDKVVTEIGRAEAGRARKPDRFPRQRGAGGPAGKEARRLSGGKGGSKGQEEGRKPDIKTSETLYYSYICKPY